MERMDGADTGNATLSCVGMFICIRKGNRDNLVVLPRNAAVVGKFANVRRNRFRIAAWQERHHALRAISRVIASRSCASVGSLHSLHDTVSGALKNTVSGTPITNGPPPKHSA